MAGYKRVYSPDGKPFDVPEARANNLILQEGWTQQEPVAVEEPKPEPEKKARRSRRKKVEEAPVEMPVEEDPVDVEEETPVEDVIEFGGEDEPTED